MDWPKSPTLDLLGVFVAVFVLQRVGGLLGAGAAWFALSLPLAVAPWTLVTSVYAHGSLGHLAANAVALAVVGFALARGTTRGRFHAFVLLTGAVAGVAELVVADLFGAPTAVIGASGAVLALYGYALAGNPVAGGLLSRLPLGRRGRLSLLVAAVLLLTLLTARAGVAIVAHATGFALGLLAGRYHVLRPG